MRGFGNITRNPWLASMGLIVCFALQPAMAAAFCACPPACDHCAAEEPCCDTPMVQAACCSTEVCPCHAAAPLEQVVVKQTPSVTPIALSALPHVHEANATGPLLARPGAIRVPRHQQRRAQLGVWRN